MVMGRRGKRMTESGGHCVITVMMTEHSIISHTSESLS